MSVEIVRRAAGVDCAAILAELPEWFGIPESNAAYAAHAEAEPTWVAEEAGQAVGLMCLVDHGFSAVEIHLLAVRPHDHRRGVGRALVEHAASIARALGRSYLIVKTRGPTSRTNTPGPFTRAWGSKAWRS